MEIELKAQKKVGQFLASFKACTKVLVGCKTIPLVFGVQLSI